MSGWNRAPGPRRRVQLKAVAKYTLAVAGVAALLWAIWTPENRVQWVLTGMLTLATWGVWLGLDRDEPENRDPLDPASPSHPGPPARGTPVRSYEPRQERRDPGGQ